MAWRRDMMKCVARDNDVAKGGWAMGYVCAGIHPANNQ
jgi:hypothetical protein